MYYRRKILLSLLEVFDNELEKIRLQKLLLLFTQKQDTPAYDFVPYKFGCFSFHANADLHTMNWAVRKEIILKTVYNDMSILIEEAKNKEKCTSLAVFKPTKILDFTVEEVERKWDKKKIEKLKANRDQTGLFENPEDPFEVVDKLPYKFKFVFEDCNGNVSRLMIEDWEIGQLYWNSLKRHEGDEQMEIKDVRKKYFDDFAKTKDLYFYFGTTQIHHFRARNPFVVIGTFHPPKIDQISLF